MTGKKILWVSFVLLLVVSVTMVGVPSAYAQLTELSVDPLKLVDIEPGENFTIAVNITTVTDMRGVGFKLDYNTTILNATLVSETAITSGATTKLPVNGSGVYNPDQPPTINNTIGRVWVAFWNFPVYTGSGVLFIINFTATAPGNSTLHLYDTEVLDSFGDDITHDVNDGEITVIPEFPTFALMAIFMIATLTTTFLGKMFWSSKRKGTLVAE